MTEGHTEAMAPNVNDGTGLPARSAMARLEFGRLSEAWTGEASDFTPLLAEQLDAIGLEIGVDLASFGESEVTTAGGRRIDILARDADGSEFVIENQYGRGDHDHLTRGLAYAVARQARGLVVVAEEHRDEFRAVAGYLNDLAEHDPQRGIAVWLVEAKAVRIAGSPWAPLFSTVVGPNRFTASVEQAQLSASAVPLSSFDEFWTMFADPDSLTAARQVVDEWRRLGNRCRLGPNHVVLEAAGPAKSGRRTVVAIYADGRVLVPVGSYAGQNTGIPILPLTTAEFRSHANRLFGFNGSELQPRTAIGWLTPARAPELLAFSNQVASAYATARTDGQVVD